MDIRELEDFKMSDAVKFHDTLNPALFKNEKLRPEVKKQLSTIAQDFVEHIGIPNLKIKDITISGSNAAYSYTKHSDIDLHILIDFTDLPDDEVYQELFTAKKTIYNDGHDITIYNIPVELYVQDTNQPHESMGEYSILKNDWIKFPKKTKANFNQTNTRLKYEKLGNLIELALQSDDLEQISKVQKIIKQYRKAGLEKTGEFGPENLAFKALRNMGMIKKLYDHKRQLHGDKLSIEEQGIHEVIDLPKKKYDVEKTRYYHDEVHFTTKQGHEYFVEFLNHNYLTHRDKFWPPLKPNINPKDVLGKAVVFDIDIDLTNLHKKIKLPNSLSVLNRLLGKNNDTVDVPHSLTNKNEAFEVFQHVSDIIHYYIRTKSPAYLVFSADPKRANIYQKIFKKINQDFINLRWKYLPESKLYLVYDTNYFEDIDNIDEMAKKKSTKKETISDEQYLNDWLINYFLEFPQPIALISAENTYSDFTYVCNMHIDPYLWVADDLSEIRVDKVQDIRNYLGAYTRRLWDTFINQNTGYPGLDTEIFKVARNDSNTLTAKQAQMQLHRFNHDHTGDSIHESASGYIPSKKEKNDPRFKTALTVDVGPDTIRQNARKLGFKVNRAGIPPLLRK